MGVTSAATARAADFEVNSDTAFQAYEVTDPWGDTVLERRRLTESLQLGAYSLQGNYVPGKADYSVVIRMRLDADFGVNTGARAGETTYATSDGSRGLRYIPGLDPAPLDIMYGYVEGKNLANGLLGFRLGRQYMNDMLGWWAFDGGMVRVTTPYYVQAEIYGGLEERGGLPLSTSRFESQGVWRGTHQGWGTDPSQPIYTDYPSFLLVEPAPAFGFALESVGPSFIHGRFDYRRVMNTGAAISQQFADPGGGYKTVSGTRVSQEKLGYSLDANKNDLGGVKGGFVYDLYNQIVSTWYAGLEVYGGQHLTVGADWEYYVPTFDADSIWNWFTHSPVETLSGRAAIYVTRRFDMSLSGGARIWQADGDPNTWAQGQCQALQLGPNCLGSYSADPYSTAAGAAYSRDDANRKLSSTVDAMGNLAARYRWNTGNVNLRSMLEAGDRGRRVGGDVDGEKKLDGGRYSLGARLSLYNWDDPLRLDRAGANDGKPENVTSFSYVLGAGYRPAKVADFKIEWEHDMNELVGQRFRILGLVNLFLAK